MKINHRAIQITFGVPWLIFGAQHFMYADFVANLVPAYFPARYFWALFTGTAMIAAGLSFIFNVKARLAAALLGLMITMFIVLLHVSTIAKDSSAINWTRALQDLSIASTAFMLAGLLSKSKDDFLGTVAKISRYLFAVLLIVFGIEQFLNLDFLTAKAASFLPLRIFWVYLTGAWMIVTGASVLINKKAEPAAFALGTMMLVLNLLLHVHLLMLAPQNPLLWTAAMLDLAITCGVFFLAETSSKNLQIIRPNSIE